MKAGKEGKSRRDVVTGECSLGLLFKMLNIHGCGGNKPRMSSTVTMQTGEQSKL